MVAMMRSSLILLGASCIGHGASTEELSLQARVKELEEMMKSRQDIIQNQNDEVRRLEGLIDKKRGLQAANTTAAVATTTAAPIPAQTDYSGALNHIWLVLCGALVMFMQAGFAMVEAGCCRAKNVQNILLKNLTDVAVGTLGWWLCGWSFAYSGPYKDDGYRTNKFMGYEEFLGHHFLTTDDDGNQIPTDKMLAWFFQWAFCSAAATIVSGGVAERVNFPGYCIYSLAMSCWIYPIVVSWTWGYGWLADMNAVGYMDFAGSGIVHMSGGVGALVGAAVAGSRNGRWETPELFQAHSLPLVVLGTFILWFGWYGFNCGSTLGLADASTGMMAAHVAMNTTIAGATGGLTVFCLRLALTGGLYDIGGFCNGILAGLVSITAGCGNTECGWAFIIALLGGIIYQVASSGMQKMKIDDPIDAFAVHGAAGAWGTLAAAIFDWGSGDGFYHGWSGFSCATNDQGGCATGMLSKGIAANLAEVLSIATWVAGWSLIVFAPLRFSGMLRASDDVQQEGMDVKKHSPSKAYAFGPATPQAPKAYEAPAEVPPAEAPSAPLSAPAAEAKEA
eukprot:TRINITY_DN349_c0_g2_i2.p1 TRINITY_DN349_c0_g2~~TRINITY_DN349_c0_g2_i2.p1  ORF type:complete len:563 (+),score=142.18 TRINITY_DN349_c0_g2_i2:93-1781(+)